MADVDKGHRGEAIFVKAFPGIAFAAIVVVLAIIIIVNYV